MLRINFFQGGLLTAFFLSTHVLATAPAVFDAGYVYQELIPRHKTTIKFTSKMQCRDGKKPVLKVKEFSRVDKVISVPVMKKSFIVDDYCGEEGDLEMVIKNGKHMLHYSLTILGTLRIQESESTSI